MAVAVATYNSDVTVFYFTRSFPYGIGEEWKAVELEHLARAVDVIVVPYTFDGNRVARNVAEGVEVCRPLFEDEPSWTRKTAAKRVFRSRHRSYFARELIRSVAFRRRAWLRSWLWASASLDALVDTLGASGILDAFKPSDVLVFFWGRGSCDVLPLLKDEEVSGIVKMHRYDLFLDVNDGYIPYRRDLMRAARWILPSSRAGEAELKQIYPEHEAKITVAALGSLDGPLARPSEDGVLRLFTCSFVAPVKRTEMITDALALLPFDVKWTHAGNGPLFEQLSARVSELPSNVQVELLGWVDTREVRSLYEREPVDLFLNVSASEGVPFSIQEALSAGVPVLATDVGGTSDVVDDTVGWLLDADLTAAELAADITRFAELPTSARAALRHGARARWAESCNAQEFAAGFAQLVHDTSPTSTRD